MDGNESNAQDTQKRGKIPYWMKNVKSTPELVMRYQVKTRELEDALLSDLRVLREINQVNAKLNEIDEFSFPFHIY